MSFDAVTTDGPRRCYHGSLKADAVKEAKVEAEDKQDPAGDGRRHSMNSSEDMTSMKTSAGSCWHTAVKIAKVSLRIT